MSTISGVFRGFQVSIFDSKKIRIQNPKRIPQCELKGQLDLLIRYLIHEGFVDTYKPLVEILQPKA
jgi:hypothetical protein